jgi:hypothetical protein
VALSETIEILGRYCLNECVCDEKPTDEGREATMGLLVHNNYRNERIVAVVGFVNYAMNTQSVCADSQLNSKNLIGEDEETMKTISE